MPSRVDSTQADGHDAVLYVWYDNEYGYSHQVVRVLEEMAGRPRPVRVPAPEVTPEVAAVTG